MKQNKSISFLFLIFYVFFFYIFWCSPYTRDDYTFLALKFDGFSGFITYVFQYGNGRLLGNLGGMALIHHPLLSCAIRAGILALIVFLVPSVIGHSRPETYLLSFLVFTFFDPVLFGEVYLWSSAFYNYVPSACLTLLSLYCISKYPTRPGFRPLICLLALILGICSQLFIEPSTISNIFFAASVAGFLLYFRKKDALLPVIFWLTGTILGALTMYAIPLVFYIEGNPTESYRSVNAESIFKLIISCCKNALKIGNFFTGMNGLPICLGAITTIYRTRTHRSEKMHRILFNACIVLSCILLITGFASTDIWGGELAIVQHGIELVLVLGLVFIWFVAGFKIPQKRTRYAVVFLILLALASLAPLLIVSPLPKRTIFQGFFLFGIASIVSTLELLETIPDSSYGQYKRFLGIITFSFIFVLSILFTSVKSMINTRDEYIKSEMSKGASHIEIFQIPYKYTSLDSLWSFDLYYHYETPQDIVFTSVDYSQWMNDHYSK